jgi:hypothetical protein
MRALFLHWLPQKQTNIDKVARSFQKKERQDFQLPRRDIEQRQLQMIIMYSKHQHVNNINTVQTLPIILLNMT